MSFRKFLIKAKIATYATEGEGNEEILEDGAKQLIFDSGDLKYRDRYYGFNPFIGEEIVWDSENVIWSMNYYGIILSEDIPAKQIYKFLQKAMRLVDEDRPFRGPDHFQEGDFEYFDESNGDVDNFSGTERILYKNKEVYKLVYHGGSMKQSRT